MLLNVGIDPAFDIEYFISIDTLNNSNSSVNNASYDIPIMSALTCGIHLYRILCYVLSYRLIWGILLLYRDIFCSIIPNSKNDMSLLSVTTCIPNTRYLVVNTISQ